MSKPALIDEVEQFISCPHCDEIMENPIHRGKVMRDKRVAKLLSIREVARHMEISAAYLSDLEHGRRVWSEGLIDDYEAALK